MIKYDRAPVSVLHVIQIEAAVRFGSPVVFFAARKGPEGEPAMLIRENFQLGGPVRFAPVYANQSVGDCERNAGPAAVVLLNCGLLSPGYAILSTCYCC